MIESQELAELLDAPFGGWMRGMRGDVEMEDSPGADLHRDKDVQNPEGRRHRDEEITGDDRLCMILNKGFPALIWSHHGSGPCRGISQRSEGTPVYLTSTSIHWRFSPRPRSGCPDPLRGYRWPGKYGSDDPDLRRE